MPGRYPIKTCLAASAVSASGEAKKKTNLLGDAATVDVQWQLCLVIIVSLSHSAPYVSAIALAASS